MDKTLPQRCRSIPLVFFAFAVSAAAEDRSIRATSCFANGPTLSTELGPGAITIGDFNEDGSQDLAVANGEGDSVSVFLGNGAGAFGASSAYPVESHATGIAAADFNGDGRTDIAVATSENLGLPSGGIADVSILFGIGGGNFAPAEHFGIGNPASHPSSIVAADFNRDGRTDIALGNYSLSAVSVLLGNGAGSFSLAGTFGVPSQNLFSIAVGDFNRDSNPDVVTTFDFIGSVAVFLGTGTGTLGSPTLYQAGPLAIAVDVADLNGDGEEDLAVADQGGFVSILLGDGLGAFAPFTSFAVGFSPRGVELADFDLDGRIDVAVSNHSGTGNVSVLLGDGLGGLGPARNFPVGSAPVGIVAGNLDGNGLPDLAVANSGSNSVSILINAAPAVLPVSLPPATVNTNYPPIVLSGSGGTPPYAFAASSNLPLAFDPVAATLYGILGSATPRMFSITITDASGCSSTRSYSLTVNRVDTPLTLTSSVNPALANQAIRLTATLTFSLTGPATPMGSVSFYDGPQLIGTAPVVVQRLENVFVGGAVLELSSLGPGRHLLTAVYSGDSNFNPSTSAVLTQSVSVPEIPTLGGAALVALALLLASGALFAMRPRS